MKLKYWDYSRPKSGEAGSAMPDIVAGKFVQIMHDDVEEYLVFSPKKISRYHADIVEKFCAGHGISGIYDTVHKRFDIHDPSWAVIGGGKFENDRVKRRLLLYDDSLAYGKFDSKTLKKKILSLPVFSGYHVQVE